LLEVKLSGIAGVPKHPNGGLWVSLPHAFFPYAELAFCTFKRVSLIVFDPVPPNLFDSLFHMTIVVVENFCLRAGLRLFPILTISSLFLIVILYRHSN